MGVGHGACASRVLRCNWRRCWSLHRSVALSPFATTSTDRRVRPYRSSTDVGDVRSYVTGHLPPPDTCFPPKSTIADICPTVLDDCVDVDDKTLCPRPWAAFIGLDVVGNCYLSNWGEPIKKKSPQYDCNNQTLVKPGLNLTLKPDPNTNRTPNLTPYWPQNALALASSSVRLGPELPWLWPQAPLALVPSSVRLGLEGEVLEHTHAAPGNG